MEDQGKTAFQFALDVAGKLGSICLLILGLIVLLTGISLAADGDYQKATFHVAIAILAVLLARD